MGRVGASAVHLTLSVVAAVLYFLFVLPRWWELMGDTSHTLGTVLRIVTGVLIALAALPVVLTLVRTRKPEFGTPLVALRLRLWSVIAHLLAGVLIVGAAIAEIWLNLDNAGRWLFGVYGAAAAIAILGILAFHLSFVAEQPPAPPKPPKAKKEKQKREKKTDEASAEEPTSTDEASAEAAEADEKSAEVKPAEVTEAAEAETTATKADVAADEPESKPAEPEAEESAGALRNKRPTGKTTHRLRRRNRTDIALDE